MSFPKEIYVQIDNNGNPKGEYLLAWRNKEDADNGKIAIYQLKEIKNKKTETILE